VLIVLSGCQQDPHYPLEDWILESGTPPRGEPVHLPADLRDRVPLFPSRFVLRTTASLPEAYRHAPVTFVLPHFEPVATVRCNGEVLAPMEDEPDHPYRRIHPQRFRVPEAHLADGHLTLEIDAPNLSISASRILAAPHLSPTPTGGSAVMTVRLWNGAIALASFWMLVAVGLYSTALFLTTRKTIRGLLAITALSASIYPAFIAGLTQNIFGPWDAPYMGFFMTLACWAGLAMSHFQSELGPPPLAWNIAAILVGFLNLTGLDPRVDFRWGAIPTVLFIAAKVAGDLRLFRRARRANNVPVDFYVMLSIWPLVGLASIPDALAVAGLSTHVPLLRVGPAGIMVVFLVETFVMGLQDERNLQGLNQELRERYDSLAAQNKEVQHLNEELRRQVHARAEELAEVLARLSQGKGFRELGPGDEVDGRYHIRKLLGRGAMGAVYEAERYSDGKLVAIKMLTARGDPENFARFAREAQIATMLAHPNIVPVYDIDVSTTGVLFLVMALIEGPPLRNLQTHYGANRWSLQVLHHVALGLDALHSMGTLHRDLKPANVLLEYSEDGSTFRARIADFGVSATNESGGTPGIDVATLTRTGHVLGTPVYLPPECLLDSRCATPMSDMFSFGIMAVEMLTAKPPRVDPPLGYILHAVPSTAVPSIATVCPQLPPDLVAVLDACLRASPTERPSAETVANALEEALASWSDAPEGTEAFEGMGRQKLGA
jgi:hypothetical protein